MKRSFSQYEQGSAEQVVAHAAWQRSRGRHASMSFVGERDPRKALLLATKVVLAAKVTNLVGDIGAMVMSQKSYKEMTDDEIKLAASHIIITSSSENEVQQRIRDELGYPYSIALYTNIPGDATGREARELARGLGGLVMKNGAMTMAMIHGHNGIISL